MTFKDILRGLTRTKVIFQDFAGPGIFKEKIQDFLGGVGTLTCGVASWERSATQRAHHSHHTAPNSTPHHISKCSFVCLCCQWGVPEG